MLRRAASGGSATAESLYPYGHGTCRRDLVRDPPQPNMIGIDRSVLVKAQVELIPADRDLKRIRCLDRKGFALGTGCHALSDVSSVSG